MNEQRKVAYRILLYCAMLDIRLVQWLGNRGWRAWSPVHWRREARQVRWAGAIADWLHNLAWCSAHDFQGFNEEWFWRDYETTQSRYPEFGMEHYREQFEQYASPTRAASNSEPVVIPDPTHT